MNFTTRTCRPRTRFLLFFLAGLLSISYRPADSAEILLDRIAPAAREPQKTVQPVSRPNHKLLASHGVAANTESLTDFFRGLHPTAENLKRMKQQIQELGADDFFRREAATRALLQSPLHSPQILADAAKSKDPEIRWRAQQVLKLAENQTSRLLYAALAVTAEEQVPGVVESILNTLPLCDAEYLRKQAETALIATATEDDIPLLTAAASGRFAGIGENPVCQRCAVNALEAVAGEEADTTLVSLLSSESEVLRLSAARALLNHGNRAGLKPAVELLEHKETNIRVQAIRTLSSATGKKLGFVAYSPAEAREPALVAWQEWLSDEADTAELQWPLGSSEILLGRTLLANYTQKKVVEYDEEHKEVWSVPLNGAWACQGLPNGHRLMASYTDSVLLEYDATGEKVWEFKDLPGKPYSVQRLENGNTLVPCYNSEIVEIRPNGSIAWRQKLPDRAKYAQMLDSSLILLVYYNSGRVVEIDRQGKEQWSIDGMQRPYGVQRLDNGNTLVANRGGNLVVEVDREGKRVWEFTHKSSLYYAQRLPNGNTLVTGSSSVIEVNSKGETVHDFGVSGVRGSHRF